MGNISSCCDKPQPGERSEEPSAPQEVIISTSNSPLKPEDAPVPSQTGVRLNGAVVTGAGDELMELGRLGQDGFLRGAPEQPRVIKTTEYDTSLWHLMQAFG